MRPTPIEEQPDAEGGMRIDKWLWAARLYATRTQAAEACRAGHVRLNGLNVKPSREVQIGDTLSARTSHITRTVRVTAFPGSRIGAIRVAEFLEDLTPPEEYAKRREPTVGTAAWRLPGTGRPTKRDRRRLDAWVGGPPGTGD